MLVSQRSIRNWTSLWGLWMLSLIPASGFPQRADRSNPELVPKWKGLRPRIEHDPCTEPVSYCGLQLPQTLEIPAVHRACRFDLDSNDPAVRCLQDQVDLSSLAGSEMIRPRSREHSAAHSWSYRGVLLSIPRALVCDLLRGRRRSPSSDELRHQMGIRGWGQTGLAREARKHGHDRPRHASRSWWT